MKIIEVAFPNINGGTHSSIKIGEKIKGVTIDKIEYYSGGGIPTITLYNVDSAPIVKYVNTEAALIYEIDGDLVDTIRMEEDD